MKYAFMDQHRREFPLQLMCSVLLASKSGFYTWKTRCESPTSKAQKRYEIIRAIENIHTASRGAYGSPRIYQQLRALGFSIGKSTVERIMKEESIFAKSKRKFKVTTDSKHKHPIAENHLNRKFSNTTAPNQVWLTDITYLETREGWLYLAAIMDMHTRKIVGWSMKKSMTQDLVLDALDMAVKRENPPRGLLHHSDRGSQYAAKAYQRRLWRYGMLCSMSRKGNC